MLLNQGCDDIIVFPFIVKYLSPKIVIYCFHIHLICEEI